MMGILVAENLGIAVSWKKTVDISGLIGTKIIVVAGQNLLILSIYSCKS